MRQRLLVVIAFVLAGGRGVRAEEDPVYEGKPLSHWLKMAGQARGLRDAEVSRVLFKLGPKDVAAVPHLVRALGDVRVGTTAALALEQIGAGAVPGLTAALKEKAMLRYFACGFEMSRELLAARVNWQLSGPVASQKGRSVGLSTESAAKLI